MQYTLPDGTTSIRTIRGPTAAGLRVLFELRHSAEIDWRPTNYGSPECSECGITGYPADGIVADTGGPAPDEADVPHPDRDTDTHRVRHSVMRCWSSDHGVMMAASPEKAPPPLPRDHLTNRRTYRWAGVLRWLIGRARSRLAECAAVGIMAR